MPQSIIQSKTYAETEAIFALATGTYNNTYAGTEIYVSDKSWHLLCYYDREAKPKSGVLKINNGDTLPNWLTPETLLIDTGTITTDISSVGVELECPTDYFPTYAIVENLDSVSEINPVSINNSNGDSVMLMEIGLFQNDVAIFKSKQLTESTLAFKHLSPYTITATGVSGSGIQAIVEFKKLYM